ncbi:hypothetical protein H5410_045276 [Solanum commersonii]|uniref:Uncharacterized protein n=1 Tax=Solanum commersonii TaxID=4109 RepID=A0A9J5XAM4_SOLCO|nr:hypothetical protein H5410_045276 [Solanum commersonii]
MLLDYCRHDIVNQDSLEVVDVYMRRTMASMGVSVAIEALGLVTIYEVGIISDKVTVLIVVSIFERVLLVVQVRNDESVAISLTLDGVKYDCSASEYL